MPPIALQCRRCAAPLGVIESGRLWLGAVSVQQRTAVYCTRCGARCVWVPPAHCATSADRATLSETSAVCREALASLPSASRHGQR
jgi:ribosomal protein L37E